MTKAAESSNGTLDFDTAVGSIQSSSAKIQINTLSPYVGFGGGSFLYISCQKNDGEGRIPEDAVEGQEVRGRVVRGSQDEEAAKGMQLCSLGAVCFSG